MKSWKTTLCGLVALIGAALPRFFPELAALGGFLVSVGTGAGLLFARDNDKSSEAIGLTPLPQVVSIKQIESSNDEQKG